MIVIAITFFLGIAAMLFAAWAQQEVSVLRQSPNAIMIIEAGGYVSYEAIVTNTGDAVADESVLYTRFVSAGGRSYSQAEFTVPSLSAGQSKHLHLGPFKVMQAGEHFLFLGKADNSMNPADSFIAYGSGTGNAILVGTAIASAGGALLAWYLRQGRT